MQLLDSVAAVLHVLSGAAWLGAMAYSFFILHPRARAYFADLAAFESFMVAVSHGARWKVLGALGLLGLSGGVLLGARARQPLSAVWLALMGVKLALLLAASALFVYVSWRLWPARLFVSAEEIPHFQQAFRRAAVLMMALAASAMVLGVLAAG